MILEEMNKMLSLEIIFEAGTKPQNNKFGVRTSMIRSQDLLHFFRNPRAPQQTRCGIIGAASENLSMFQRILSCSTTYNYYAQTRCYQNKPNLIKQKRILMPYSGFNVIIIIL
jgi:hypothetical protein